MSNPYWEGFRQASLERSQITAAWGRPGLDHSGASISIANRAFEVYYTAHQNISASAGVSHYSQMLESLHEAGRTGWGVGVTDLEESFEHLTANGGRWTDNNTLHYSGGQNSIHHVYSASGPAGPVNFLKKVNDNIEFVREVSLEFSNQVEELTSGMQSSQWAQIGEALDGIETWGERAKPFLWWAPAYEHRAGQVVSLASVLGTVHTAATMYTSSRSAGFDPRAATALAALRAAVAIIPVLGDFYGRAVEMIPGLANYVRGLIDAKVRRLDAAAAGAPY